MTARGRLVTPTGSLISTVAGALLVVAVTGACSSAEPVTADHAAFDGLPADAVDETLDLLSDVLGSTPEERRPAVAQDAVVELGTCRAVLTYVESWTGVEPPAEPLVLSAPSPRAFAAATGSSERPDIGAHDRDLLEAHVAGGNRVGLVEFLTAEAACAWMPVEPGGGGPSINEVARATYGAGT